MKINRKIIRQIKANEDNEDGHVEGNMSELISMVWELTKDAWSFVKGQQDAEQRLQRDVAVLIRRKS